MGLFQENQKAKIIFEADDKIVEMDCYIAKIYYDRLKMELPDSSNRYHNYLKSGTLIKFKIFSQVGIISQDSIVLTSPEEKDFTVEYDANSLDIQNRRHGKRYSANCNLVIFRPLLGNIETKLIDISARGLRYYSDIPLETGSIFDCKVTLTESSKIMFKGKVLDNKGLPAGVYRMLIDRIAYKEKQILIEYCENVLANNET